MKLNSEVGAYKRIVVACDGTWMDSDGEYQVPSNVTRICRCIRQEGQDAITGAIIPQIIYYQAGVGTESTIYDKVVGGSTGLGTHYRTIVVAASSNHLITDTMFRAGRKYTRSLQLHLQQLRYRRRNLLDWVLPRSLYGSFNRYSDWCNRVTQSPRIRVLLPNLPGLAASIKAWLEVFVPKISVGEPPSHQFAGVPSQAS